MENTNQQIDPKTLAVVKALAYTENGGAPNVNAPSAGKTGEMKSIFQFEPGPWTLYAEQTSGNGALPMNAENETKVVYSKVHKWLQEGYKPEQIASMWNAGENKPDAYKQGYKGINKKYGVAYDTPGYVKKFSDHLKSFGDEQTTGSDQAAAQPVQTPTSASTQPGMMSQPTTQPAVPKTPPFTLKRKGMLNKPANI